MELQAPIPSVHQNPKTNRVSIEVIDYLERWISMRLLFLRSCWVSQIPSTSSEFLCEVSGNDGAATAPKPSLVVLARQFTTAMLVLDTWQYFMHRYMHKNKFLNKHIHSQHHRLVVPYAYGALYNHPLEGFLLDTFGGSLSFMLSGMSPRASIFFFFSTIITADDHCGLWLPGNLFHVYFRNNTAYHDIHHQLHGNKYNFSKPFFVIWDRVIGTHMPYS